MPEEVRKLLPVKYIIKLNSTNLGEIGILRLLPKILKLKHPSFYSIDELTSRGIKSSIDDPINSIASILSELSKKLYEDLKTAFKDKFNFDAPPKLGSDEAMNGLKTETFSNDAWKFSLEANADFTDMYSNAREQDVIDAYKLCFKYSSYCQETQLFIIELIHIVLRFNYFKEPTGIFTSNNGFAMGCKTSAISTDILLLASEFRKCWTLSKTQLKSIKRFYRFRDDINLRLQGSPEFILPLLKDLVTGYPSSIDLNVKVTFFWNTFLNLRSYLIPTDNHLSISILRKSHDRFDIVPSDSFTNPQYIGAAVRTAACNVLTKTSHNFHKKHQIKVYNEILSSKGYNCSIFKKETLLRKRKLKKGKLPKNKLNKIHSGKITFDSVTRIHTFLFKLLKLSKLPADTMLPVAVGSKKVKNFAFTKKKFYKKLCDLHNNNNN